ncbi:MAG: HAD family hydrolase [Bacteroidales bacterium]
MSNTLRACIFDMDGTMVKNHEFHLQAWIQFWEKHGVKVSREQMLAHFGRKNREIIEAISGVSYSDNAAEALAAEKEELYRELYKPHVKAVDGLPELLECLRKSGIKIALATSAPRANVDFILDALGLRTLFDCIVDASMVDRGKPHPDIFLKAAACAGALPAHCLVFEDANAGLEASRRAGCRVVALLTTHNRQELGEADFYIKDFTEWPLAARHLGLKGICEGL